MNVAVCFNRVPPRILRGEAGDRISEEGAEAEATAVHRVLTDRGHRALLLPLADDITAFAASLRASAPEVVFNLCEGFWGDSRKEMHVAALFELLGLAYTGSPPLTLGLVQDKVRTKNLLQSLHLPTPRFFTVPPGEEPPGHIDLAFPLFVKPRAEDASLGVSAESVTENMEELRRRVLYIHRTYRQDALVEEYIEGREINAALLGDTQGDVLPLSEICFHPGLRRPIVSYDGKWRQESAEYAGTEPLCPAPLATTETERLESAARCAFTGLGCRDYARVDFRLRDGIPYILEVNANPDISPDAGLARAARRVGIEFPQLIERILQTALRRKESPHAHSGNT